MIMYLRSFTLPIYDEVEIYKDMWKNQYVDRQQLSVRHFYAQRIGTDVKQTYYEMTDLFMDFGLSFWDRKWGLMTTQLVMTFDRVDLEKLLCYLQFITGVISEQDSAVCRLIADGTMCEHDVQEKDGV